MTEHYYKHNAYYMLYLIRCVLHDKIPVKEKLGKMDLSQLYTFAKSHSLTVITAYALESAGINDVRFKEAKSKAIRKTIYFEIERSAITSQLEKSGIWYMPLKGIIMKDYYPKISMREMCDNDILFDKSRIDDIKSIMKTSGFEMKYDDNGHDLTFYKEPVCNFEMHTELFGAGHDQRMNDYYSDVRSRLIKDSDNSFGYHFSNEDFYVFMIAHEYKHFYYAGTGLRSLLDTYVFVKKFNSSLDWEYINAELQKLGINDYEQKSRNLALKLFQGIRLNNEEKELLDYYIFSETYGNTKNRVKMQLQAKSNNRLKYIFGRIVISMDSVKRSYPTFYKYPILLPLLPIFRAYRSIKSNKNGIISELKILLKL